MIAIKQELSNMKKQGKKASTEELERIKQLLKQVNSFRTQLNKTYSHLYTNPQTKLSEF